MSHLYLTIPHTLDEVRPQLETLAQAHGLILDFLMRAWNGRMATYNLGEPTEMVVDPRRGGRHYRIIGRLKFNTTPTGTLAATLAPPTACDPAATPTDEARFAAFVQALIPALDAHPREVTPD